GAGENLVPAEQLEALQTQVEELTAEVETAKAGLAEAQKQAAAESEAKEQVVAELEGLKAQVDDLTAEVETAKADLAEAQKQAAAESEAKGQIAAELASAQATLVAPEALEGLQTQVDELTAKMETAKADLTKAQGEAADAQKRLEEALAERDELTAQLAALSVGQQEFTVVKPGFAGPVAVTVSFAPDGSIAALSIGDDGFAETPGYGATVREDEYLQGLIGKVPPLSLREAGSDEAPNLADAVSGATVTSQAVIDAINEAFAAFSK
ncbi:MAG: FMN-binding protein, partial [Eubacteriales bacterium]|nr:FMN-binding protein [Eubacteriales bacterium]